ncbi:uncharacterized protein [Argopecten irradians]|uniref:uncharacterized protein n=1 Tax=Argopecten irradians TaxID=31199 RepID=UPI00371E9428
MDVQVLISIFVTLSVCGVKAMSPMMQDMNADIMKDIMNLRKKIENHQRTLSNKGAGKDTNSVLPAAEIAMREFFSPDRKSQVSTKKSKKSEDKKPKNTIKVPDVPETLKNSVISDTNAVPVEKKKTKALEKNSKSATDLSAKDSATEQRVPSDQPVIGKSETTGAPQTTSMSKTKRSRRRSRRRKSSKKSKSNRESTPAPETTTTAKPATSVPTVQQVPTMDTGLPSGAETAPGHSMQTAMTHMLSQGQMMVASMLARAYPRLMRLLGGASSQGPMIDPNVALMMNGDPYLNGPAIPGDMFGQSSNTKQHGQSKQSSSKKSSSSSKRVEVTKNPMQLYMERELCSETPSRLIRQCQTTQDCRHKMKCFSGYCCASSHRHAEMLDNLPEYIGMPPPQRSWRNFFK